MINLIKKLLLAVISVLPDSPFPQVADSLDFDAAYMPYLNWFLPLDTVGSIMLAWLDCVLAYVLFLIVWKVAVTLIVKKVAGAFSVASLFGGK